MKKIMYLSFLFVSLLLSACGSDENTIDPTEPYDLNLLVVISEDGSGDVAVTASAQNATEYQFYMGAGDTDEPFTNSEGYLEYKYTTLGTYVIEVRAFGSSGRYIKKTKQIVVQSDEPVSVGEGYTSPTSYPGMTMVWNDEFEGTSLNTNNWSYDNGDGCPNLCGWGNNELEYYRPENSWISGGVLTIEARAESYMGRDYTSTKIVTRGKQSFQYGRIDVRAVLPKGQGLWPAFWALGVNQTSVGWPKCGEIDFMEMIGGNNREKTSHGNVFWDNNGVNDFLGSYTIPEGFLYDKFHVFSVIWDESQIRWLVDDVQFHSFSITPADRTEFHQPFYLIMNIAVGGNFPGSPDATTVFPTQMLVDYIRVFQEE